MVFLLQFSYSSRRFDVAASFAQSSRRIDVLVSFPQSSRHFDVAATSWRRGDIEMIIVRR